jgi:type IV secretory pathway component VirB8
MSATVPAEALVDRPEDAQDIAKIIRSIVDGERTRRRWQILLTVAPWLISAVFGLFAVGAGIIVAHRPVPIPRVEVAIYRSDGTVEAPVERGELSMERKAFIVRSDLQQFIVAWESYAWLANQAFYNRVSAMTAGEHLQTAYQESWRKRNDPENREVKYGQDTTRNVVQIITSYVAGSPGALTARFQVKTTTPTGSSCEWWAANLTFKQDNNTIPLDKQLAYDPSDIVVATYFSTPADSAAKPWAC